jgi:SAM-dependent methyltransferase
MPKLDREGSLISTSIEGPANQRGEGTKESKGVHLNIRHDQYDKPFSESLLERIGLKARHMYNNSYSALYRKGDDAGLQDWTHIYWCDRLRQVSALFERPIDVLVLGCGTGRYFHCLENLNSLTGVDISDHMLAIAKHNPVLRSEIKTKNISLIHGDLSNIAFREHSFDFIYSIGVLGEYVPISLALLERMHGWLRENGRIFFTVEDCVSRTKTSRKRSLAILLYPILPGFLQSWIYCRIGDYSINEADYNKLLQRADFRQIVISRRVARRIHLYAIAEK